LVVYIFGTEITNTLTCPLANHCFEFLSVVNLKLWSREVYIPSTSPAVRKGKVDPVLKYNVKKTSSA